MSRNKQEFSHCPETPDGSSGSVSGALGKSGPNLPGSPTFYFFSPRNLCLKRSLPADSLSFAVLPSAPLRWIQYTSLFFVLPQVNSSTVQATGAHQMGLPHFGGPHGDPLRPRTVP